MMPTITFLKSLTLACLLLTAANALPRSTRLPAAVRWPTATRHGNWCGAEHIESDEDLDETLHCKDTLDCACRAHQICQHTYGTVNCLCDNHFVDALSEEPHTLASLYRDIFSKSLCYAPVERLATCRKCSYVLGEKVCRKLLPCSKCQVVVVGKSKKLVTKYAC